jgi:hypothetical protein
MKKNNHHYRSINWYHPFNFIGRRSDDDGGADYGFDLDLQTAISFGHYEYGYVLFVRIFGFGFQIHWLEF